MNVEIERFLAPVSADAPCGVDLSRDARFLRLQEALTAVDQAGATARLDWGRYQDDLEALASIGRDLRVWVWLARAWLARDGIVGLARGIGLIAAGLERFFDTVPPIEADPEVTDPGERFGQRLNALVDLGGSSRDVPRASFKSLRSAGHLSETLRLAGAKAGGGPDTAAILGALETGLATIEAIFRERFGAGNDPQLDFTFLREPLAAVAARPATTVTNGDAREADGGHDEVAPPVGSRAEVVSALDQVLDYYRSNEPASPVPLLVQRAKRLVNMSFLEAIRELAPGGLKELQTVAGSGDEAKPAKSTGV